MIGSLRIYLVHGLRNNVLDNSVNSCIGRGGVHINQIWRLKNGISKKKAS